jgi:hypothetical protein
MLLILLTGFNTKDIQGILKAIWVIDLLVIVPSAVGTLITGILFSTAANWGFLKHRWITVKYLINLLPILLGGILLAPRLIGMMEIAQQDQLQALSNPAFLDHKKIFTLIVIIQFILLLFALYLSVIKPKLRVSSQDER